MYYERGVYGTFFSGFGLERMSLDVSQSDPFGNNFVKILSYWCCCIDGGGLPFFGHEKILVGVINTDQWRRGYLTLSSMGNEEHTSAEVDTALTPKITVDLKDWQDPVAQTLNQIYFFPVENLNQRHDRLSYSYEFRFDSLGCEGGFKVCGPSSTPLDQLYEHLLETVSYFAQFYDTPEIRKISDKVVLRNPRNY